MRTVINKILRMPVVIAAFVILMSSLAYADDQTVSISVPAGYDMDKVYIEVDGVEVEYTVPDDSEPHTVAVPVNNNTKFIVAIENHPTIENCPEHMYVWEIFNLDEEEIDEATGTARTVTARALPEFEDLFYYEGFAIRPETKDNSGNVLVSSGFRCSQSILTNITTQDGPVPLKSSDGITTADGMTYTAQEYGQLHIVSSNWNSESRYHMTIGDENVLKARCYVRGSKDAYLSIDEARNRTIFANTLTDIVQYNINKNFRTYIKFTKDPSGETVYLYGPIVGRNPYYVASHLDTTNASTAMRNYVDEIIASVEGTGGGGGGTAQPQTKYAFFIGDSIMEGTVLKPGITMAADEWGPRDYTDYEQTLSRPSKLLGDALAYRLQATVDCTLIANGGATYSEPGANLYNMPSLANTAMNTAQQRGITPDYIFLMAGVNDWAHQNQGQGDNNDTAIFGTNHQGSGLITNEFAASVTNTYPDGDYTRPHYTTDDRTYCIGVDRTIRRLSDKYPDAKIIVCSPLRARWISGPGTDVINESTHENLNVYSFVQGSVSDRYRTEDNRKVYFVNLYDDMLKSTEDGGMDLPRSEGSTPENAARFKSFFPDGIHPTPEGYEIICNLIMKSMDETYHLFD